MVDAVVSGGIAAVALFSAAILLALLLHRPGFRHRGTGYLICVTLLCCGVAHGMSAAGIWRPLPDTVLAARIATLLAGLATAIVLLPRVPAALDAPSAEVLAAANARLQAEIGRRGQVEAELRTAQSQLEAGVSERTADLVAANERLEREIRERRSMQESLHQAIEEREALLREVHHRVKNNLQMMTSLLNLQIRNEKSDVLRQKLREMQARLGALSLVHKKLYGGEDLTAIDLANLLAELCRQLGASYRVGQRGIVLDVVADPLLTDMDHAIPLALLVTEAVTNALKHAFPEGRAGTVSVGLRGQGSGQGATALLRVADDGVGMARPEIAGSPRGVTGNTLGMTVMRGMARQLDGELELRFDRGVEILVTMRLDALVDAPGLRRTA